MLVNRRASRQCVSVRPRAFRGTFREDEEARAVYSEAAGIARSIPAAVAIPADAEDVRTLMAWAHATGSVLIPRGSGSSMAGGAVGAGVVVDLSRLRQMDAVDAAARRIWVGPGALRGAVNEAAAARGLRFPVDPSSGAYCTVGGMASTNAAGAHTLRFGATRSWVASLDCVFDDGSRAIVRRGEPPPDVPAVRRFLADARDPALAVARDRPRAHPGVRKDSSGYAVGDYARSGELVDLLVGSEGTLALFVGLELALAPRAEATSSLLAAFPTLEQAVEGAVRARDEGASACELLDRTFLDVAAAGGRSAKLPPATEAVLLAEVEGASAGDAAAAARRLEDIFREAGASEVRLALDVATEAALWELRHAASPILARLDPMLKSMQFIEDGAVPPERLADYVRGVRGALEARGIRGVIFGHAGDAHVHVNPLVDVRRPDWRAQITSLLDEVTGLTARLGGTLAGEHGDGRLRTPLLERVIPDRALLDVFRRVKRAFDPLGILNPGVKVPRAGQAPIEAVKYDPSLPPLPHFARRVLDRVERERAYARGRLELLEEEIGRAEGRGRRAEGGGRA
jgi:FAD/FMN-containing dehydrogenase